MKRNNYSISLIGCVYCFFLLAFFSFQSNVYPAPSDYFDTVQKTYIGYYQRPADPTGLIYWAGRLNASGGNLTEIIEAFANSAESQALYGTINSSNISTVVNAIYKALFGRDAEAEGLNYYVNGFNSGQFTPATIMLNVLYGAQNEDLQSINNKLTAANLFTRIIDPELDGANPQATYSGNTDAQKARDFLSRVGWDPKTILTQDQVTLFIKTYIADPDDPIGLAISKTIIAGTVSPPANVDPSSLRIVSPVQTSTVNSSGAYTTEVYSDGVAVVAAMPLDKQFGLMNVVALLPTSNSTSELTKGERKIVAAYQSNLGSSVELNAKTTAVSMVFITPYFLTNDPAKAATIIGIIENDPKVQSLALIIESVFGETDPLSNPVLQQGLIEAVQSVLDSVSTQASKSIQAVQPSSPKILQLPRIGLNGESLNTTTYYADRDYVTVVAQPSSGGYNLSIESIERGSVDWIADVILLDSSQFSSLVDFQAKASSNRTIYNNEEYGVLDELYAPAKSVMRYLDIIDLFFDWVVGKFFGNAFEDHTIIPSDQDSIYLIRAYSGGRGKQIDPRETSFVRTDVPNGSSMDTKALATNIFMVCFDTLSAFAAFDDLFPEDMDEVMKAGLEEAYSKIAILQGNPDPNLIDLISVATDIQIAMLSKITKLGLEMAAKNLLIFAAGTIETVAKSSGITVIISSGAALGKVGDRLLQLSVRATPMESSIIVVGNPFPEPPPTIVTKDYFPLSNGATWNYTSGSHILQVVAELTNFPPYITQNQFKRRVMADGVLGSDQDFYNYDSNGNLLYYGCHFPNYDPDKFAKPLSPVVLIPSQVEIGKTYTSSCQDYYYDYPEVESFGYEDKTEQISATGPFSITVPAGSYSVYKVRREWTYVEHWIGGTTGNGWEELYLAKGIGPVQIISDDGMTWQLTETSANLAIYSSVTDHWYQLNDTPMRWADAKTYAESKGGYLATVTSASENKLDL